MTTAALPSAALPSSVRTGLSRGGVEVRQFFRAKEQVIFTFTFPAIILVLLGSIFDGRYGDGVSVGQVFAASMAASGIVATSFVNLGISVALDREDGTLKRLRGTPVTAGAYFAGKMVLVAVASLGELVFLVVVGMILFDVTLPTSADRWFTFVWVFVLSIVSCSLVGVAISAVAKSAQSAAAVVNVPYIALQFMSGVYITIDSLPTWMQNVGSLFPIKWAAQGFRSVFLPDSMMAKEAAGSWELGKTALVLGGWCVLGLALCLLTFRWTNKRD
ncbi:ABC transporter permease [Actinophytocola oryzae]|uniref:Transport permease protein n=1 Tax=Actinophytocola oryzae TaxID=502181 RepID=A0A4R7UZV6_9PSEU|nr:ABC transporter permease [Actinophytocola oryzae]TDV41804.1 ABC-2 type transport system permease protein [Actinophytocola oryzae]